MEPTIEVEQSNQETDQPNQEVERLNLLVASLTQEVEQLNQEFEQLLPELADARRLHSEQAEKSRLLQLQVEQLKAKLSEYELPSMAEVVERLAEAGFYDWVFEVANKAQDKKAVMIALYEINAEALKPKSHPSVLKRHFWTFARIQSPTMQQAVEWQAVLDEFKIPKHLLQFLQ